MNDRVIFLDYLRVIACFMVMLVHSIEPFYLGGEGTFIANAEDAFWVTIINSALRPCILLFILASSYLLFPLQTDSTRFFKRRAVRVVVPLMVWVVLYAIFPLYGSMYDFAANDALNTNLLNALLNFPGAAGHLWFVYMIIGVYLIMPLLSPWISQVSRRKEELFLAVWGFTTAAHFLRYLGQRIYGLYEVWGEGNWNEYGTLYYVSGFIGVLVLGHYLRTYHAHLSWKRTLAVAIPCFIIGYAITAGWFWMQIPHQYPVEGNIDLAVHMEKSWRFTTTGPVLMTIAYFLVIQKINLRGWFYDHLILPISRVSYGMYLMHIFILSVFVAVLRPLIPSTPLCMLAIAFCSYVCCFVAAWVISKIPVVGKYIVG